MNHQLKWRNGNWVYCWVFSEEQIRSQVWGNETQNVELTAPLSARLSVCERAEWVILCVRPERRKDERHVYHITSLVSTGIFRPWASTFSTPQTWYSIQCLRLVWVHRGPPPADARHQNRLHIPPGNPSQQNSLQVGTLVTACALISLVLHILRLLCSPLCPFACFCLFFFVTSKKKQKKPGVSLFVSVCFYTICQLWERDKRQHKERGGAALCPQPWLTPGECSCGAETAIRRQWGKSNLPFCDWLGRLGLRAPGLIGHFVSFMQHNDGD